MSSNSNSKSLPHQPPAARPRIGLALAGGGPLGAIFEIGALCALEEAVRELDLNALDGYVGVSAGGVVAAQRESLARATAALDRAMDVLMPRQAAPLYGAGGAAARNHLGSGIQA